jgi:hypothetical protein
MENFGTFYGDVASYVRSGILYVCMYSHLVFLWLLLYIFSRFGLLHQEKSGNPAPPESMYACTQPPANVPWPQILGLSS